MSQLLTAGCDPEVLFTDGRRFRSVVGILPGTKSNPHKVFGGAVQVDNVCGEFNTHPAESPLFFSNVVEKVYWQLCALCPTLIPTQTEAAVYDGSELESPESRISGCEVDWNAYSMNVNPPVDYSLTDVRCAGGHLHFGIKIDDPMDIPKYVKAADLLITVPMMIHEGAVRRLFYGKAGSFRPKPYGFEHRSPSNFWIFTDDRRRWVYEQMQRVAGEGMDMDIPPELEDIINTHDRVKATELVSAFSLTPCPV